MSFVKSTAAMLMGMFTTLKHTGRPAETVSYPEVKRPVAPKYRGRHRLHKTKMEVAGQMKEVERCIGCHLCAAACPSQAIYVEAADNNPDNPNSPGERFAVHYEINMLRCIFCGYCEEACPVDAIKLGSEYELADTDRHAEDGDPRNDADERMPLLGPEVPPGEIEFKRHHNISRRREGGHF